MGPALVCWGGVGGPTAQGLCRDGDGGPWEEAAGRGPPSCPGFPAHLGPYGHVRWLSPASQAWEGQSLSKLKDRSKDWSRAT